MRLASGREHTMEYVRTLCTALLLWTDWHSGIPAQWYCEEPIEASLRPLGALCKQHTQHIRTWDINDLWLNVHPGSAEVPHLPPGGVPSALRDTVQTQVCRFLSSSGSGVTPLPWRPQGVSNSRWHCRSNPGFSRFQKRWSSNPP